MPVNVELSGHREAMDYLRRLPGNMYEGARKAMADATTKADAQVKKNLRTKLSVRSGALRRSIRVSVAGASLADLRASIYSASLAGGQEIVYAPVHEFGATIKAKNAYKGVPGGPYLNIPAKANKTASGVTRMQAREVFAKGGHLVRFGRKWAVYLDGRRMFSLVKSVKIPARLGMGDAAEAQVPTLLSKLAQLGDE